MNFKKELAKWGYNGGNSIDVDILVDEILPEMFNKKQSKIKQLILSELWEFCEREFRADFEIDYIGGIGSNTGMSDRTDVFVEHLAKIITENGNKN